MSGRGVVDLPVGVNARSAVVEAAEPDADPPDLVIARQGEADRNGERLAAARAGAFPEVSVVQHFAAVGEGRLGLTAEADRHRAPLLVINEHTEGGRQTAAKA